MYLKPNTARSLSPTSQNSYFEYPKSIFLIIATEFCERFSFCGLRTILSLYLRNVLFFHENKATEIFHIFIMLCYLVPVIGASLADSYLGRFRTILVFSVIYATGNVFMCFSAIPEISISPLIITYIGLMLIAWGTGGIKPCVAAFGCDQFYLPQEKKRLQKFFSIFYFTINFGGLMGMILMPILRQAFTCFDDDTCYALGFGFPAVLMIIALLLFLLGKPLYRLKYPKENIMLHFIHCILYAVKKKLTSHKNQQKSHWLDYADDKFSHKLIEDIKKVLAVLYLYIPLPFFWSLFDQQGSRWTFQASRMNGEIFGLQIHPDQLQVINPAIVLMLIPIFDKYIYSHLSNKLSSPLIKMIIGGIFAGFAFIISGFLELNIEKNDDLFLKNGASSVLNSMMNTKKIHMLWMLPQYFFISVAEVMFAISGLEFSFTQAPKSMKTVTLAAWYVSVALGNLIIILITHAQLFSSQVYEFFFFACLIIINMIIFSLMTTSYDLVEIESDSMIFPFIEHDNEELYPILKK